MKTVKELVVVLGGCKRVAAMCDVSSVAVWQWTKRNNIPVGLWPRIINTRIRNGESFPSLEEIYYCHTRHRVSAGPTVTTIYSDHVKLGKL